MEQAGPTVCRNVARAEGTLVLVTGTKPGGEGHRAGRLTEGGGRGGGPM